MADLQEELLSEGIEHPMPSLRNYTSRLVARKLLKRRYYQEERKYVEHALTAEGRRLLKRWDRFISVG